MSANIKDVAKNAGVSPSTVSRAYRFPDKVKPATLETILAVAEELGYSPNHAAQSLITGRRMTIGLLIPDIENPFFASIVKGVERITKQRDYQVLLVDTSEDPGEELHAARQLASQVDGLLLCGTRLQTDEIRSVDARTPVVLVNREADGVPSRLIDDHGGSMQAVRHVHALGHRSVAYLAGPERSVASAERARGVAEFAAANGMAACVLGPFDPTFDGGGDAADDVIAAGATAVIAHNDVMAIGLVQRLGLYGISVPGAISVVGFDDIPVAQMTSPPLTTVRIAGVELGEDSARALFERLDGAAAEQEHAVLRTRLVVRGSTGPAIPAP
ncbi:transcriptional regulator, LacI family [Ruaniaceae bacterium KH17]|nr:transcriptional regulator, LacI family [Ruaniaceae bacterium KH17]